MRLSAGRRATGVVAALALALTAWTGAVLTWRYRPDGGGPQSELPSSALWSRGLVRWHEVALYFAIVALLLWCGMTVASLTGQTRRRAVVVGSMLGAAVMLALSAVAWTRVRWQQLGLWAVTEGETVSGLWYAAFSDKVRFVFVDGSDELPPSDLAPWVVLYLVAPFVALAMLAVGWMVARPTRGPRRAMVEVRVESAADDRIR